MTKQQLAEALKPVISGAALVDFLLGLPEADLATLPLPPLRKHAAANGIDLNAGELAELLKAAVKAEKKRPHFEKIGGAPIVLIAWIVWGIIEAGSLCMIFGASGTFKSFLTIALCACIATGREFFGHKVKKGAVYYIAAEGQGGIIRRFRAFSQEAGVDITNAPLYRYTGAVNLLDAADILISALEETVEEETEPPALAVIDTWSRALAGDDSDTAAAAEGLHKLDMIRAKFPAMAILLIHHVGHKEQHRARGASLIHAGVDSEFRVEKDAAENIIFTNTKSKESELLPPMAFRARSVKLLADNGGFILNENGEPETSAVLEQVDYEPPKNQEGMGKNQKKIVEILENTEEGKMTAEDLLQTFKKQAGGKKDGFDDAVSGLVERGIVYRNAGFICLGKPQNE
jgi:hypothetical protein